MNLASILHDFLAPLSGTLLVGAIISGLIMGCIYYRKFGIPSAFVYHTTVAGWIFIGTIFIVRLLANQGSSPWGWFGIAALWLLFCFVTYIGLRLPTIEEAKLWLRSKLRKI